MSAQRSDGKDKKKMSAQRQNTKAKRSPLDADKMYNEKENLKEKEADPTSSLSIIESGATVSSASPTPSATSEAADELTTDIMDRVATNIGELKWSISKWETEENLMAQVEDKSAAARHVQEKVERQLSRFFKLRRVFAEHVEDMPSIAEEDLVMEDTMPGISSAQDGHVPSPGPLGHDGSSNTLLGPDKNEDEILQTSSSDLDSRCSSLDDLSITASIGSTEDIQADENTDRSSVPLDQVDVVDQNVTQDITTEEDQVTEDSITSTTHERSVDRHTSKLYNKMKFTWKRFFSKLGKKNRGSPPGPSGQEAEQSTSETMKTAISDVISSCASPEEMAATASIHPAEELSSVPLEQVDVVDENVTPHGIMEELTENNFITNVDVTPGPSQDITATPKDLTSIPVELMDVEDEDMTAEWPQEEQHEVCSAVKDADFTTTMDSTPGPSGHDEYLGSSHTLLGPYKNEDEILQTSSSDLDSRCSSLDDLSITASIGSTEDIQADENTDRSSVPLDQVDVVDQNVTQDITTEEDQVTEDSITSTTHERSVDRHTSKLYKKMKFTWKRFFTSKLGKKNRGSPPGPSGQEAEQSTSETMKTAISDVISSCASPEEMVATASIHPAEELSSVPLEQVDVVDENVTPHGIMEELTENNFITNVDVTPGPSQDITATPKDLTSVPVELMDVEDEDMTAEWPQEEQHEVCSAVKDADFTPTMDSTPGPSGHDEYLGSSHTLLGPYKNEDEILQTSSSDLDSRCSSLDDLSITASIGSTEDIQADENTDRSSVPLDQVDVVDQNVTQDITTEEDQVTEDSITSTTHERSVDRHTSKLYKKMKFTWKRFFTSKLGKKNRGSPPGPSGQEAEQPTSETMKTAISDVISSCASPEEMAATASIHPAEELSSVPLEQVDVVDENVTPHGIMEELTENNFITNVDVTPGPSQDITATPKDLTSVPVELMDVEDEDMTAEWPQEEQHEVCSAVKDADFTTTMDSTPGPSGHDEYLGSSHTLLGPYKNEDEILQTSSSDLDSRCSSLDDLSITASISSTEDIQADENTDRSSVPLDQVDVVDQNVTQDITTEEDQVTEDSITSTTHERSVDRHTSKLYKKMKFTWKRFFTSKLGKKNRVSPLRPSGQEAEQSTSETMKTAISDVISSCASPEEMAATASIHPAEELSSVPLEQVDVVDENVTPHGIMEELTENNFITNVDVTPGPSQDITATPKDLTSVPVELMDVEDEDMTAEWPQEEQHEVCSAVKDADFTTTMDSTPGPSQDINTTPKDLTSVPLELMDVEDEDITPQTKYNDAGQQSGPTSSSPPAELPVCRVLTPGGSGEDICPKSSGVDNKLTTAAELTGLKKTFYVMVEEFFDSLTEKQQKEMSRCICDMDVQRKLADMLLEVLRLVIETVIGILSQAEDKCAPTSSQLQQTETFVENLPLEVFGETFGITEDTVKQSLSCSLDEVFSELAGIETAVSVSPNFTETVVAVITDEVNSVLFDTIKASLEEAPSSVSPDTQWASSCCTPWKERSAHAIEALKSQLNAINIKKTTQADETTSHSDHSRIDKTLAGAHTSKKRTLPWWCCLFKRRNIKVSPVSDTDNKTQIPKRGRTCHKGKKKEKRERKEAPAQDPAVNIQQPSLLKRLRRFCGFHGDDE